VRPTPHEQVLAGLARRHRAETHRPRLPRLTPGTTGVAGLEREDEAPGARETAAEDGEGRRDLKFLQMCLVYT